jgi:nucleoside-diphosphate-sugar epimerase
MAGELVLLTGATGHLGLRVLVAALEAGYHVRAAIRSKSKGDKILATPSIKKLNPGSKLEFITVPDMLAEGAYDEAIKDATYAIHVASPITSAYKDGDDYEEVLIKPAVKGTLNILDAAQKAPGVKRVVITSSVVAIIPWAEFTGGKADTIWDENSRTASPTGPYANTFEAYGASKVIALNETEKWIQEKKPTFDVVNIFPSFVVGADELNEEPLDGLSGTNFTVLKPAIGQDASYLPGTSVHVKDVALAHVKALDSKVPGNQGYVLSSEGLAGTKWEQVFDIVKSKFPDEVAKGVLPNNGNVVSLPIQIDERRSEKLLGMKYRGFEEQAESTLSHYLSLL